MAGKHSLDSNYSFEPKYDQDDYEEEGISKKKVIIILCIIILIIVIGVIIFKVLENRKEEPIVENTPVEVENKMIETYAGYDVLGKIVIEDLGVEQYILDSTEDEALENGVIKLYGGSLNNYGNFCIAGHNYENVFQKLAEMEIGDTFTIIDENLEETTYKIQDIYSVEADDLKCLLQNEDKIEITLITCENAATTRLVVKAEEITEDTEEDIDTNTNTINSNSVEDSKENV